MRNLTTQQLATRRKLYGIEIIDQPFPKHPRQKIKLRHLELVHFNHNSQMVAQNTFDQTNGIYYLLHYDIYLNNLIVRVRVVSDGKVYNEVKDAEQLGEGAYGYVSQLTKFRNMVVKLMEFQDYDCEQSRRNCLFEVAFIKLCAYLQIGPDCFPDLLFDMVMSKQSCIFHMERCENIDERLNHTQQKQLYKNMTQDILGCTETFHKYGLVHRDIKPENILYNPKHQKFVLSDFGLAKAVPLSGQIFLSSFSGTPQYSSDEMYDLYYNNKKGLVDLMKNDRDCIKNSHDYLLGKPLNRTRRRQHNMFTPVKKEGKSPDDCYLNTSQSTSDTEYSETTIPINYLFFMKLLCQSQGIDASMAALQQFEPIQVFSPETKVITESWHTVVNYQVMALAQISLDSKGEQISQIYKTYYTEVSQQKEHLSDKKLQEKIKQAENYKGQLSDHLTFYRSRQPKIFLANNIQSLKQSDLKSHVQNMFFMKSFGFDKIFRGERCQVLSRRNGNWFTSRSHQTFKIDKASPYLIPTIPITIEIAPELSILSKESVQKIRKYNHMEAVKLLKLYVKSGQEQHLTKIKNMVSLKSILLNLPVNDLAFLLSQCLSSSQVLINCSDWRIQLFKKFMDVFGLEQNKQAIIYFKFFELQKARMQSKLTEAQSLLNELQEMMKEFDQYNNQNCNFLNIKFQFQFALVKVYLQKDEEAGKALKNIIDFEDKIRKIESFSPIVKKIWFMIFSSYQLLALIALKQNESSLARENCRKMQFIILRTNFIKIQRKNLKQKLQRILFLLEYRDNLNNQTWNNPAHQIFSYLSQKPDSSERGIFINQKLIELMKPITNLSDKQDSQNYINHIVGAVYELQTKSVRAAKNYIQRQSRLKWNQNGRKDICQIKVHVEQRLKKSQQQQRDQLNKINPIIRYHLLKRAQHPSSDCSN